MRSLKYNFGLRLHSDVTLDVDDAAYDCVRRHWIQDFSSGVHGITSMLREQMMEQANERR
ncbi:hypothetical protein [Nocardia nova]|uniref:hypothetical protein n=1 Tax=Nocardia nova TaxID=37330 RepID=UPI00273A09A8|nr:hypothetical protein [Nocardia nova]